MLKPSEYVAAALRGLRSAALAGNAAELTCGEACAEVTRVASVQVGEDDKANSEPSDDLEEDVRVLALAADFPDIRKGAAADLDGGFRIVTSVRVDAAGATLTVGLSAEARAETVGLSGVRKGGAKVATSFAAYVLSEARENPLDEGSSSSSVRCLSLAAYADALADAAPQTGDVLTRGDGTRFAVRSVDRSFQPWRISAREVR